MAHAPNEEEIALLEARGWQVDCLSPLEISLTEDGSSCASGLAAAYLWPVLLQDDE